MNRLPTVFKLLWLLFSITTFRHFRNKVGHYFLLVAIVAVGVGAFNGIRQASRAASANFGLFNQAVSGRSDFLIESPSQRILESSLLDLQILSEDPDWHLVPVIEGSITTLGEDKNPDKQIRLIGLDLLALGNLPNVLEQNLEFAQQDDKWHEWLGSERDVWIGRKGAEALGAQVGDEIPILASGRRMKMKIRMILDDPDGNLPEDLALGDIPTIQNLLSRKGEINRVEVILDQIEKREDLEYLKKIENRLAAVLPKELILGPTENRAAERAAMTAAFRLNLSILSLIAILVGAYLILQALDAAVVRRRVEIATLRSLGIDRSILFLAYLLEALLLGLLGSIAGVGVGYLLAFASVGMLADTVNALYFSTSIEALTITSLDLGIGIGLGLIFSFLAGWLPARDATQTPPAQILARGDWSPGFSLLKNPKIGLSMITVGILSLLLPPLVMEGGSNMPLGGFIAAGCWILGLAFLSGHFLVLIAGWMRPLCITPSSRLACSRLQDGSSRHRLAVAGLVVAVGMVTGMFQMIDSFRGTIQEWFEVRFQADLYVSERGVTGAGNLNGIDPELMDELLSDSTIRFADVMHVCYAKPKTGVTILAGVDLDAWNDRVQQIWLKPPGSLKSREGVEPALISEAFARRFDLLEGGVMELDLPSGRKSISPYGIFSDYGNEFGTAAIDSETWKSWTGSRRPVNASLYLKDEFEVNAARDRLRVAFPGLDVRNGKELREVALGIFEQTFKATDALSLIGLVVAFAGLLLGLLSIFDESNRTWQTLRHLGFSTRQFLWSASFEGAGIGLTAWVSGSIAGLAMGWVLVHVINVQSFGWTLIWNIPIGEFLLFGILLIGVGFFSGFISANYWNFRRK